MHDNSKGRKPNNLASDREVVERVEVGLEEIPCSLIWTPFALFAIVDDKLYNKSSVLLKGELAEVVSISVA